MKTPSHIHLLLTTVFPLTPHSIITGERNLSPKSEYLCHGDSDNSAHHWIEKQWIVPASYFFGLIMMLQCSSGVELYEQRFRDENVTGGCV
jgi:hypothetical protein